MPRFDVTAARREIDAGREAFTLTFNDKDYVFPGALPAAVEIEQMALQRDMRGMNKDQDAAEQTDRMMRAVFGEHYEELIESVGTIDLTVGMGALMQYWAEPFQDPQTVQGMMTRQTQNHSGTATSPIRATSSSSSASSTSTRSSKRTSSESTESTSPGRSSSNGSPGGDSSAYTGASAARQ